MGKLLGRLRPLHAQRSTARRRRAVLVFPSLALLSTLLPVSAASGDAPTNLLHGGMGKGVKVLGHTDLGGGGLNGHVAVLGDYAYVGYGTNGGYAGIWNKTPKCRDTANPSPTGTVKVVSLQNAADPKVVTEIDVTAFRLNPDPHLTLARDVAALRVRRLDGTTYDLLAVALEGCGTTGGGLLGATGVNFYDVTDPANPKFLSHDAREVPGVLGTRQVSLAQPADGRVLAFEANIGGDPAGAIDVVDVTNPLLPLPVGRYEEDNNDVSAGSCRPFGPAAGVSVNPSGTRAYAAYYDQGVIELDVLGGALLERRETAYPGFPGTDEGNSFRFLPNADGSVALATDEDLNPARTTLTLGSGETAQTFVGCEAIWGDPLYTRTVPSLADKTVVYTANTGCTAAHYDDRDVAGKISFVDRGGCGFHIKAKLAQDRGALAVLIGLASPDAFLFSPDSALPGDAGIDIPVVVMPYAARQAMIARQAVIATEGPFQGTLTDTAESWGALTVFDLATPYPTLVETATGSGEAARQVSVFHSPHSNVLTPGNGLYHAVNAVWDGHHALVAWMSDGVRLVNVSNPSAPAAAPSFFVPPAAADPTGNYAAVPLVVDVEKHGSRVVVSDVNGGLYVLAMARNKDQCKQNDGWRALGFFNKGECVNSFD